MATTGCRQSRTRSPDFAEFPREGVCRCTTRRPSKARVKRRFPRETPAAEFIGFRLKQGVYGQRQVERQMVRVKLPFGGINPDQLDAAGQGRVPCLRVKAGVHAGGDMVQGRAAGAGHGMILQVFIPRHHGIRGPNQGCEYSLYGSITNPG